MGLINFQYINHYFKANKMEIIKKKQIIIFINLMRFITFFQHFIILI